MPGKRFLSSRALFDSDLGKLILMNFDEVTANTFQHLIDGSAAIRARMEKTGGQLRYTAYGYHGTEILINGHYEWQTYTNYSQGPAKMRLERIAEAAWAKDIKATVYNCPEIRTNSSDIFVGVELSLFPLLISFKKEAGGAWAEAQWQAFVQFQRQFEQVLWVARKQLELCLADGRGTPSAADLPAIQAQFNQAAVGAAQVQAGARESGRKRGCERGAQPRGAKHFGLRRLGEQAEVQRFARERRWRAYHPRRHDGVVRYLTVRHLPHTAQCGVHLVAASDDVPGLAEWAQAVAALSDEVRTATPPRCLVMQPGGNSVIRRISVAR